MNIYLVVMALDPRSRVCSSSPTVLVMCKSIGQALNPHCHSPTSSNGYQMERKLVLCEWLQLQKMWLHSSQTDKISKERVPVPWRNWCSVGWTCGDIWIKDISLHLFPLIWAHWRSTLIMTYIYYYVKYTDILNHPILHHILLYYGSYMFRYL